MFIYLLNIVFIFILAAVKTDASIYAKNIHSPFKFRMSPFYYFIIFFSFNVIRSLDRYYCWCEKYSVPFTNSFASPFIVEKMDDALTV